MIQVRRKRTGDLLILEEHHLQAGGEARIFAIRDQPGFVAKIYHTPTRDRIDKVAVMLANVPDVAPGEAGHTSIAWPCDLLTRADGSEALGFMMQRATRMSLVVDYYNPKTRREEHPHFNFRYLVRTARNLSAAVQALHAKGYVIGDVNESNILVSSTALVTVVDTDSFQVPDPSSGVIFRCRVGKAEFTPPELQGKNFPDMNRLPEHDRFGLAVLVFQMLMEGTHPFAGRYTGRGDPRSLGEWIARGSFPYGPNRPSNYGPKPSAPLFESLHPEVRANFIECFEAGNSDPMKRPTAVQWRQALDLAEKELRPCNVNNQHFYDIRLISCPWCERRSLLGGRDPFPPLSEARNASSAGSQPPFMGPATITAADRQQQTAPSLQSRGATSNNNIVKAAAVALASLGGLMVIAFMVRTPATTATQSFSQQSLSASVATPPPPFQSSATPVPVSEGHLDIFINRPDIKVEISSVPDGWTHAPGMISSFSTEKSGRHATGEHMPPGHYEIVARLPGWPEQRKDLTIENGGSAEARFEFIGGTLRLNSTPVGALADENGNPLGQTPLSLADFPTGEHTLNLHYKDWPVQQASISISAGQTVEQNVHFPNGSAEIESVPPGADVSAGDVQLGKTPLTLAELPAGALAIKVRLVNYQEKEISALIQDHADTRITANLQFAPKALDPDSILRACWIGELPQSHGTQIADVVLAPVNLALGAIDRVSRSGGDQGRQYSSDSIPPRNGIVRHLNRSMVARCGIGQIFQYTGVISSVNSEKMSVEFQSNGPHPLDFKVLAYLGVEAVPKFSGINGFHRGDRITIYGRLGAIEEPFWRFNATTFEIDSAQLLPEATLN